MDSSEFKSGNFQVSTYSSIDETLSEGWNNIPRHTFNYNYLKFIEDTRPLDLEFKYILIKKEVNGSIELCGAFYFQLLNISTRNFNFKDSIFLSLFSSVIFSIYSFKMLICGNLFAVNHPALWYNPDIIRRGELLIILSDFEKKAKCDVLLLKDLDEEFAEDEMKNYGLLKYEADLTMELEINPKWKSIEDYVNSLTKKYRKRAQKIISTGNSIEKKELSTEEIKKETHKIFDLFCQVSKKQMVRMGLIQSNYFYEFKKRFPDKFSITGYYFNNQMVAFSSFVDRENTLEMHYIGIDYKYNKELLIYFNLLIDGIKNAIREGKKHLELGRTAREAKANLGGIPVYFNDYYYTRGKTTSYLVKKIISLSVKRMDEGTIDRNPLKK